MSVTCLFILQFRVSLSLQSYQGKTRKVTNFLANLPQYSAVKTLLFSQSFIGLDLLSQGVFPTACILQAWLALLPCLAQVRILGSNLKFLPFVDLYILYYVTEREKERERELWRATGWKIRKARTAETESENRNAPVYLSISVNEPIFKIPFLSQVEE